MSDIILTVVITAFAIHLINTIVIIVMDKFGLGDDVLQVASSCLITIPYYLLVVKPRRWIRKRRRAKVKNNLD